MTDPWAAEGYYDDEDGDRMLNGNPYTPIPPLEGYQKEISVGSRAGFELELFADYDEHEFACRTLVPKSGRRPEYPSGGQRVEGVGEAEESSVKPSEEIPVFPQEVYEVEQGLILCCVPADTIITLFDPTDNKLLTMAAFASVTMCNGILLAHYLRKASNNFTVTLTALNTVLKAGAAFNYALWVTLIVILTSHAAAKMVLTTIFPGIALDRFKDYLLAEVVLYSIQVVASSVFGLHYNLGDSVTDSIANSWLFGNGAAAIVENVEKLTKGIDWDKKLGLEDDDDFFDIGHNNNQDEVGLISSWDD